MSTTPEPEYHEVYGDALGEATVDPDFEEHHARLWAEDLPQQIEEHGPAVFVLVAHQDGQTSIRSFMPLALTARALFDTATQMVSGGLVETTPPAVQE